MLYGYETYEDATIRNLKNIENASPFRAKAVLALCLEGERQPASSMGCRKTSLTRVLYILK
jgi:hypothetical protein